MKRTNTYETPMTEVVEIYAEAAFLATSGVTQEEGFYLPDLEEGVTF